MSKLFYTRARFDSMLLRSFLIVVVTITVQGFNACEPKNCGKGGPNITYPFWIADGNSNSNSNSNSSHCGNPKFSVKCNGKNPTLEISREEYLIKNIFYNNNSLIIENYKAYDLHNTCPVPFHNFTTFGTPFKYSSSTFDIFFFYNCTQNPIDPAYYIACHESNSTRKLHSFAVYHKEKLFHDNYSMSSCMSSVNVPIEAKSISLLMNMNFTDVLRNGFVLEWEGTSYCNRCISSGGGCGYDNKGEFVCFCNGGGSHSRTCHDGFILNLEFKVIIGITASVCTLAILSLGFFLFDRRKKPCSVASWTCRMRSTSQPSSMEDVKKGNVYFGVQIFSYNELEKATDYFDPKKQLGDGGFGSVYKGKLRDGRVVAVKRLYESNSRRLEHFMNEVEILARLHHKNLVILYGCTSYKSQELLLVFEYIQNGTLADHLHSKRNKSTGFISWTTRLNIAVETANALAYLHASDVIHRDVKTTNILIDNNFCVKVADFGLSRLFPLDATHVSTAPQGTPGYVDPEYQEFYRLTDKSDVYSFGVVLVELISSKQAVDITRDRHEINLSTMAINKIHSNALHELVDTCLGFELDFSVRGAIIDVAELAFRCLQSEREMRPTMKEVAEVLRMIQSEGCDSNKRVELEVRPTIFYE